jgi:hypothetical protein
MSRLDPKMTGVLGFFDGGHVIGMSHAALGVYLVLEMEEEGEDTAPTPVDVLPASHCGGCRVSPFCFE